MGIRVALTEDLPRLVEIYNQAIAASQRTGDTVAVTLDDRLAWFDSHPPDKYPVLVEKKDGAVLGYLGISAYRPGRLALRHTAEVSFYVDFDYHRQGVASRLIQHAIELCPALQIKTLFAILMETNSASIQCLKSFDFEQWAHLPSVADYDGVEVGQVYFGRRIG
jgi:phosphinothricin acetyltransferase